MKGYRFKLAKGRIIQAGPRRLSSTEPLVVLSTMSKFPRKKKMCDYIKSAPATRETFLNLDIQRFYWGNAVQTWLILVFSPSGTPRPA